MADVVANIVKGRFARYCDLPETNDAVIAVLLQAAGIEADSVLIDYDTLAAVLAASNDEATFTGYSRMTLANVTVTVDDTNNRVDTDADNPAAQTNSGGAAQGMAKLVICYDSDTTGGTDANIIPMIFLDCLVTYDVGVPVTLNFATAGFGRAS